MWSGKCWIFVLFKTIRTEKLRLFLWNVFWEIDPKNKRNQLTSWRCQQNQCFRGHVKYPVASFFVKKKRERMSQFLWKGSKKKFWYKIFWKKLKDFLFKFFSYFFGYQFSLSRPFLKYFWNIHFFEGRMGRMPGCLFLAKNTIKFITNFYTLNC